MDQQTDHKQKTPSKTKLRFLGAAMLVVIGLAAGFAGGKIGTHSNTSTLNSADVQKQQVVLKSQGQLISSIAKNVGSSVVSVEVTGQSGGFAGSFFGMGDSEQQSAGTGIILNKDGLIITNRHVVPAGTTKVSVTTADGTKFDDVTVVGRTSSGDTLDIAFIKIKDLKGKELTPAAIGDSSKVQVGDSVVAIGNALGQFQNTVTSGIISGFGRQIQASDSSGANSENLEDLFQTDAAINEGNSGGPLVNINGEVIGINTAVAGSAQNIGFALPINDVSGLIKSVQATGKLERPYLGTVFIPITADVAKYYELSVSQGAYIPPSNVVGRESVIADGPAAKAGIKAGDIITKVDDNAVDAQHSLTSLLGKRQPGDSVKLTVVRDGKSISINAKLGTAPSDE